MRAFQIKKNIKTTIKYYDIWNLKINTVLKNSGLCCSYYRKMHILGFVGNFAPKNDHF